MNKDRTVAFLSGIGAVLILGVIAVPAVWSQVRNDVQTAEKKNTEYAAQVARLEADLAEADLVPILDPIAAYCRGSVDNIAFLYHKMGAPTDDAWYAEQETICATNVGDGALQFAGARGPLLPDEPSD